MHYSMALPPSLPPPHPPRCVSTIFRGPKKNVGEDEEQEEGGEEEEEQQRRGRRACAM